MLQSIIAIYRFVAKQPLVFRFIGAVGFCLLGVGLWTWDLPAILFGVVFIALFLLAVVCWNYDNRAAQRGTKDE